MKRLLSFFLAMIAITLSTFAQGSSSNSSTTRIELEVRQTNNSAHHVHRAPMRINIEAYYDEEGRSLNICYDGEVAGEVFLFLNENIIGYDSDINTSFPISTPGLYKIEITGGTWIAVGYIQL